MSCTRTMNITLQSDNKTRTSGNSTSHGFSSKLRVQRLLTRGQTHSLITNRYTTQDNPNKMQYAVTVPETANTSLCWLTQCRNTNAELPGPEKKISDVGGNFSPRLSTSQLSPACCCLSFSLFLNKFWAPSARWVEHLVPLTGYSILGNRKENYTVFAIYFPSNRWWHGGNNWYESAPPRSSNAHTCDNVMNSNTSPIGLSSCPG